MVLWPCLDDLIPAHSHSSANSSANLILSSKNILNLICFSRFQHIEKISCSSKLQKSASWTEKITEWANVKYSKSISTAKQSIWSIWAEIEDSSVTSPPMPLLKCSKQHSLLINLYHLLLEWDHLPFDGLFSMSFEWTLLCASRRQFHMLITLCLFDFNGWQTTGM